MIKYLVRYRVYDYDLSTRYDTRNESFATLEEAQEFYETIQTCLKHNTTDRYCDKRLHMSGFIDKLVGIFKITEEKVV